MTPAQMEAAERALGLGLFPAEEYAGRIVRLREAMAATALDGVVVSGAASFAYLSGMQCPLAISPSRPVVLVVAADGRCALICSRVQSAQARATSWVADIRTFEGFEDAAVAAAADAVRALGLAGGRLGFELGHEQRMGMSPAAFDALKGRLAGVAVADAAEALWHVRLRKSPAEVAVLRESGRITADAFERALAAARPGLTERAIYRELALGLVEQGAEPGYLAMHSGPGSYRRVSGLPSDRVLQAGDLLWMDGGGVYRGYWADVTRTVSMGRPPAGHRRRYALAWEITGALLDMLRPGVTPAALVRRCHELFAEAGVELASPGRVGHGLGLALTEPPSLVGDDDRPLPAGAVVAIEPAIAAWDGYFVVEENAVITPDGPDLLSRRAPPELPCV